MGVRSIGQLKRDQAALLAAHRSRLGGAGSAGGTDGALSPRPALQWGRITQVVTSDETYGPHLMAQGYVFAGTPPSPASASAAPLRCYPAPGKAVGDYAVDDYVSLTPTAGAVIAERIT